MKVLYFISLLIVALFFNACAPQPIVYSPEEIDTFAIPPSAENNLFSPPPKGYARLIIYRDESNIRHLYDVFVTYEIYNNVGYEYNERALCRLSSNSSCIVNIRAGGSVLLVNYIVNPYAKITPFIAPLMVALSLSSKDFWNAYAENSQGIVSSQGTIFTPKNQHIYCANASLSALGNSWYISTLSLRDKDTCLKEYQKMYKPKHRKYQEKWLNKLIKEGDKRAYKE